MEDVLILLVLLVGATALVSVFAWMGRLTNPFMLILLPAMTVVAAVLALITRTDSPLLPVVALLMALSAVALILTAIGLMLAVSLRSHRHSETSEPGDKRASGEAEA